MTVAELTEALKQYPDDAEVLTVDNEYGYQQTSADNFDFKQNVVAETNDTQSAQRHWVFKTAIIIQ